jgi:hypothetical protein
VLGLLVDVTGEVDDVVDPERDGPGPQLGVPPPLADDGQPQARPPVAQPRDHLDGVLHPLVGDEPAEDHQVGR